VGALELWRLDIFWKIVLNQTLGIHKNNMNRKGLIVTLSMLAAAVASLVGDYSPMRHWPNRTLRLLALKTRIRDVSRSNLRRDTGWGYRGFFQFLHANWLGIGRFLPDPLYFNKKLKKYIIWYVTASYNVIRAGWVVSHIRTLMKERDTVSENLVYLNHLTPLSTQQ
jgi:hypothetical protein